jgi:hypothetical protein
MVEVMEIEAARRNGRFLGGIRHSLVSAPILLRALRGTAHTDAMNTPPEAVAVVQTAYTALDVEIFPQSTI